MNEVKIHGDLRRGDETCAPGHVYWLDVKRNSGVTDTLLVLSPDDSLPTGSVHIRGYLKAEYICNMGVPVFIVPVEVTEGISDGVSETVITGTLKKAPKCKETRLQNKILAKFMLITENGPVPVLAWNSVAKKAEETMKPGDNVKVVGRMQGREYPDRNGEWHRTYELSARTADVVKTK